LTSRNPRQAAEPGSLAGQPGPRLPPVTPRALRSLASCAFPEMDAGPIPVGLEHREPYGILAGAEDPADQALAVLDAPKTVVTPGNIEMMRSQRSQPVGVRHCALH